jgi:hypothetical protein
MYYSDSCTNDNIISGCSNQLNMLCTTNYINVHEVDDCKSEISNNVREFDSIS